MVGRLLIYAGVALILLGIILLNADKLNFLGKLPGDFTIKRENFTFYFPLMTSILISILLSGILYLINKLR